MFTRVLLVLAAGVGLSACQPAVPDSGRGVGFDDLQQQRQRDAALASSVPSPAPVSATPLSAATTDTSAAATAAETARILAATGSTPPPAANGSEPLVASPANPAPAVVNSSGISQENNFDAVSAQRGIESDAARIAANRAQYQTIQPEALPDRGDSGPNIAAYALQNTHPVGTKVYRRSPLNGAAKNARNCAQFGRPVLAQIAFLENGGPQRDRAGLNPDGDGFACSWDPTPFRNAAQG